MRLPDLSAFKFLIHCPGEPDILGSDRYHNRNAEEKIISAALKGLDLKESVHLFAKTAQKYKANRRGIFIDRYFIHLGYFQEVLRIHR